MIDPSDTLQYIYNYIVTVTTFALPVSDGTERILYLRKLQVSTHVNGTTKCSE